MHLLMETAIVDSEGYQILPFEEVEELKRERTLLRSRIEATRRKLTLEGKLRDAAQSLNRLYSTKGRRESGIAETTSDGPLKSPRKQRRSLLGSRGSNSDALSRTDDELAASTRKMDELTQELARLEKRYEETSRRILEHTAGILQLTHNGLDQNARRDLEPQDSAVRTSHYRGFDVLDRMNDFDERSLYRSADDGNDNMNGFNRWENGMSSGPMVEAQALDDAEKMIEGLNNRLRGMILSLDPDQRILDHPPIQDAEALINSLSQLQAHLSSLSSAIEAMDNAQSKSLQDAQSSLFDSQRRVENINVRLHGMLERTDSGKKEQAPITSPAEPRGKSLESQLAFSDTVVDLLNRRVERLVEQKDILTRQIQQQRELNSKSDAQRNAQIVELTREAEEARHLNAASEQEHQLAQDRMTLLMEQLDFAQQEAILVEQQRGIDKNKAFEAGKEARRQVEDWYLAELESRKVQCTQLQANLVDLQNEIEIQRQYHTKQFHDLKEAKEEAELGLQTRDASLRELEDEIERQAKDHTEQVRELMEAKKQTDMEITRCHDEMKELEGEIVRAQTDLTVVRAELDGAYGTRAQRAADVSMNPAIQKVIDDLNDHNSALQRQINHLQAQYEGDSGNHGEGLQKRVDVLQKELVDTLEDYEVLTRASVEAERERGDLEASLDNLLERCDMLEAQLNDERIKWLGIKNSGTGLVETTSTMVLKNEFKKMMRDTRAESLKALQVRLMCTSFGA